MINTTKQTGGSNYFPNTEILILAAVNLNILLICLVLLTNVTLHSLKIYKIYNNNKM